MKKCLLNIDVRYLLIYRPSTSALCTASDSEDIIAICLSFVYYAQAASQ